MKTDKLEKKLFPVRQLTVTRKPGTVDTASIMLAGRWLENAGFKMGDIVHLEVNESSIVIRRTELKWVKEIKVVTTRKMVNEYGTPLRG